MNVIPKILIADKMHSSIVPMLKDIGWGVDYLPKITRGEILQTLAGYEGLIIRSKTPVDRELVERGENLKMLARAGAGIDQIDLSALEERNITLINAPEGNRNALAEHALGMLLALLHNISRANNEVKGGIWQREANRGLELTGKTVGIYGFGYMGSAFAEKLQYLGCRVVAYDKYKEDFSSRNVQEVTKSHFEQEVEILSIHVPLTSETRGYFTEEYLRRYPKLKFIVNTSRGEVLSLQGILNLIDDGILKGAALDVLENEKLDKLDNAQKQVFDQLTENENILLTPHIAGWTKESYVRINEVIVSKMIEMGLSTNLAQTSKN